jgi:hypothetical protein
VRENTEKCHALFIEVLELAKEKGELNKTRREISDLAMFLFANLSAIRQFGKSGMDVSVLRAIKDNALKLLE